MVVGKTGDPEDLGFIYGTWNKSFYLSLLQFHEMRTVLPIYLLCGSCDNHNEILYLKLFVKLTLI